MKKLLGLLFGFALFGTALAQNAGWPPPAGAIAFLGVYNTVLPTITNGQVNFLQTDANGKLLVSGSFSASTTGFRPVSHATPISVTTGGVSGTLPTNTGEVVATNVGTTNGAYCALGASATTSDQYIAPNGGWFGFAISGDTQLTCITSTSTTTVDMVGGSGLPTGTGGGGGSGGGGAVTIADGADVALGAKADAAWSSGDGTAIAILKAITGAALAPVPGYYATAYNTCSQVSGTTAPICVDLNGNMYANISRYMGSVGSVNAAVMTVQSPAGDPCQTQTPTIKPFSITTNTTTNIVTGTSAKKLYVCYLYMQSAAADNIAVISGTTGATCGSNTAALVGGTTAANGLNNAANSGQAFGNGGYSVMQVLTNNDDICIITSAATPLAGLIKYVVQ